MYKNKAGMECFGMLCNNVTTDIKSVGHVFEDIIMPRSPLIPQLNILKNLSKVRTNLRAAVHAVYFRVALAGGLQ